MAAAQYGTLPLDVEGITAAEDEDRPVEEQDGVAAVPWSEEIGGRRPCVGVGIVDLGRSQGLAFGSDRRCVIAAPPATTTRPSSSDDDLRIDPRPVASGGDRGPASRLRVEPAYSRDRWSLR